MEIEGFVNQLKKEQGFMNFKRFGVSAFVQSRKKIKPEVFNELNSMLMEDFYTDNELGVKRWNGFRLLAVDGSMITLPYSRKLKAIYGTFKNQYKTNVIQARISVLYDVQNKLAIAYELAPSTMGERKLALKHLNKTDSNDLLIYDRGYPSFDFFYQHLKRNLNFVIRAKVEFSKVSSDFIKSGKKDEIVSLYPKQNKSFSDKEYNKDECIKVRLVRVHLPSGQIEVLITSLMDQKKYSIKSMKNLYFQRWQVETYYDELKNKLKLENFSGYSPHSVLQDFNAAIFVSNVQTLIVSELEEELQKKTKDRKLRYKVNTNLSYGHLKNRVISIFLNTNDINQTVKELKELFLLNLTPIRPDRSNPREANKYRNRKKPKVTKNQRDAF